MMLLLFYETFRSSDLIVRIFIMVRLKAKKQKTMIKSRLAGKENCQNSITAHTQPPKCRCEILRFGAKLIVLLREKESLF